MAADDEVWRDYLAWLRRADDLGDPAEVFRAYGRALEARGVAVVESFASPAAAANRRPVDIDPADLLRAFDGCRIRRFEDTDGVTDWTLQVTSLVRLVAERRA